MRRPTFCTSIDSDERPVPCEKESRLSKMKRMITGGILVGGRSSSNNVNSSSSNKHQCKSGQQQPQQGKENHSEHLQTSIMELDIDKKCVIHGHQPLKEVHIEVEIVSPSATTEIVLKPRKRKERLDSGGSINKETKVIRSSSEERPECKSDITVRRVSSHGELIALAVPSTDAAFPASKTNTSSHHDSVLQHVDEALELQRNTERFSRAVCAPRGRRVLPKKRRNGAAEGGDAKPKTKTKTRSPSPRSGDRVTVVDALPKFDVSSLHQQMEGSDPITSRGKVLSPEDEPESPAVEALISPRNSLVMRLTYLDPNLPPSPPKYHYPAAARSELPGPEEKRLNKQMHNLRRQVKQREQTLAREYGRKVTKPERDIDADLVRLSTEHARLKAELMQLRNDLQADLRSMLAVQRPVTEGAETQQSTDAETAAGNDSEAAKPQKSIEEVIREIEKRLEEKRILGNRGTNILEMTREELLEEKLAMQKALLHLENICGRPADVHDKDLARHLYQRYRTLKRLVLRHTKLLTAGSNGSVTELATILEHEAMEFSNPSSMDLTDGGDKGAVNAHESKEEGHPMGSSSSSSESLGDNLHALPLSQLLEQQKLVKQEKKQLRRSLREFDKRFQSETGRRAQKQDRVQIEGIYVCYKQAKAKLRLLEALITKKSQVKRNSC